MAEKLTLDMIPERQVVLQSINFPSLLNSVYEVSINNRTYKSIPDELYYAGMNLFPLLQDQGIAVIGTRKPSESGLLTATNFGGVLASNGYVVVSGNAFGIDSAAQTGALNANGKVVAFLGGGLGKISGNNELAVDVVNNSGMLVTEYNKTIEPVAKNFPQRNRLVVGSVPRVVLIEAETTSGSRVTLRLAYAYGRKIGVYYPNSKASGSLNRQLVEGVKGKGLDTKNLIVRLTSSSELLDFAAGLFD